MAKINPVKGKLKTHILRVTVQGLDVYPSINPVAGYCDKLAWERPVKVLSVCLMPATADSALDMVCGVCLALVDAPTSNASFAGKEGLCCATGSAVPPVVPAFVEFAEPQTCQGVSLIVYQSNASYSKTGTVLSVINVIEPGPPIYKV